MEERRAKAAGLFKAGRTQAEVARALQVSRQSVSRWHSLYKRGGVKRLKGAGRAGRKPRLDARQLSRVDAALRRGARAHGFQTSLWTLLRVAVVIERVTGVEYHPGHVWRVLQGLEWSLQRPAKRARERNDEAVRQWVSKRWPSVKKTRGGDAHG
jgi:transposase